MQREADLAGQLGQHPVVLLGEGVAVVRPLEHDQAEQLARVADRRPTRSWSSLAPDEQVGQPHRDPRRCPTRRPG